MAEHSKIISICQQPPCCNPQAIGNHNNQSLLVPLKSWYTFHATPPPHNFRCNDAANEVKTQSNQPENPTVLRGLLERRMKHTYCQQARNRKTREQRKNPTNQSQKPSSPSPAPRVRWHLPPRRCLVSCRGLAAIVNPPSREGAKLSLR